MHADLLVIGGGPAALAAANAYRDHDGPGSVVLVSDEPTAPYARPALSKEFLRGDAEAGDIELAPAGSYPARGITLLLRQTVTGLDAHGRTARLGTGEDVSYGSCVLATGADPAPLRVPGADAPGIAHLRSLAGADALRTAARDAGSAVVIGSGFIGCEAAVSLARRGLDVIIVSAEPLPQQERLGPHAAERIAGWLAEEGVTLVPETTVEAFEPLGGPEERPHRVRPAGRPPLEAGLVLVAGGITPRSGLAEAAGATVEGLRVTVDEHLRSSLPGLFAAGDVAYARNASAGRHLVVEHWGDAEAMGAVAGANAAGADRVWDAVPGFWTVIGDHTLQYAGWGDGFAGARFADAGDGAFTVWYSDSAGRTVGVAAHDRNDDYELGERMVAEGSPAPELSHPD